MAYASTLMASINNITASTGFYNHSVVAGVPLVATTRVLMLLVVQCSWYSDVAVVPSVDVVSAIASFPAVSGIPAFAAFPTDIDV